jgi:SAM-dependent methyltransferase
VTGTTVSLDGIRMDAPSTADAVDVLLDDKWVWSFNPARDATPARSGVEVGWPEVLRPHLRGSSRVALVAHASKAVLFEDEVVFTDAPQRVTVVDRHGHHLAVDKGGRLQRKFDDTDQSVRDLIITTVDQILTDLREQAGLDAFVAFGCLLGAVRTGKMIGHDADADVAYLSKHTHPLDIIRENRAAARTMRGLGYRVVAMSSADFKIWVPLPDGRRCGVDVFGGYYLGDHFYLLPTVHGDLDRSALLPTSTVVLEGHELVAPARPEELLALTYGPSWRVPDPAFKYEHPRWLTRHMDGYWRGARNRLREWDTLYKSAPPDPHGNGPSAFARWAQERVGADEEIVDVGAGIGEDAVWFAAEGHPVLALEYSGAARRRLVRAATRAAVPLQVEAFNLLDVRSTLTLGARLAHRPRTRHVYARALVDHLSVAGRRELFRFAAMVSRRGGLTLLEFRSTDRSRPEAVIADARARGGEIVTHEQVSDPEGHRRERPVNRVAVRWRR